MFSGLGECFFVTVFLTETLRLMQECIDQAVARKDRILNFLESGPLPVKDLCLLILDYSWFGIAYGVLRKGVVCTY